MSCCWPASTCRRPHTRQRSISTASAIVAERQHRVLFARLFKSATLRHCHWQPKWQQRLRIVAAIEVSPGSVWPLGRGLSICGDGACPKRGEGGPRLNPTACWPVRRTRTTHTSAHLMNTDFSAGVLRVGAVVCTPTPCSTVGASGKRSRAIAQLLTRAPRTAHSDVTTLIASCCLVARRPRRPPMRERA